jgi:hypothetical protein
MHVTIAIMGVIAAAAAIIFLSTVAMNGFVKAAVLTLVILLAVYGMARIPPNKSKCEKDTGKERVGKSSNLPLRCHKPTESA